MPISYGSKSNADIKPFRTVMVTQVDLVNLYCEVREVDGSSQFTVSLRTAVGHFYHLPSFGEEWIVTKVSGLWSFYRKTSTQNPAITALKTAEQGDIILNAQNKIRVISPLVVDAPLTLNSTLELDTLSLDSLTLAEPLVQAPITNTWKLIGDDVPALNTTEIGTPVPVVPNKIATVVGARLKMLYTGTFAVSFWTQTPSLGTGRSFIDMFAGPYFRRNHFSGEDIGHIETTIVLQKDDLIQFNLYHSATSSLSFTHTIDITQVR